MAELDLTQLRAEAESSAVQTWLPLYGQHMISLLDEIDRLTRDRDSWRRVAEQLYVERNAAATPQEDTKP